MFRLDLQVRDYECDVQGIVNNAVYQNYLEHARHQFLLAHQIDFVSLAQQGLNLVVLRAELDYKNSLRPGDDFYITVECVQVSRLKFMFVQNIYRGRDDQLMLQAKVTGAGVNSQGRPVVATELAKICKEAN